jgi:hypothetical protein
MMKSLTALLALVVAFSATAQKKKNFNNYYDRRVHIGAKVGANMTKIDGRGFNEGFRYGCFS